MSNLNTKAVLVSFRTVWGWVADGPEMSPEERADDLAAWNAAPTLTVYVPKSTTDAADAVREAFQVVQRTECGNTYDDDYGPQTIYWVTPDNQKAAEIAFIPWSPPEG